MDTGVLLGIVRALFVLITSLTGIVLAMGAGINYGSAWGGILGALFGLFCVGFDKLLKGVTIRGFSSGTFGLLVGLLCAWLVSKVGLFDLPFFADGDNGLIIKQITELALFMGFGFLGTSLALRTNREEFSFVVPYVRFRKEASYGQQPLLVDSGAIIDGRLQKISKTGFLQRAIIVPRFVIDELNQMADSHDPVSKAKGKQGLDTLAEMRSEKEEMDLTIYEDFANENTSASQKIVSLANHLDACILSNDRNLAKVAELNHAKVLNLNDLASAVTPSVLPGDQFEIELVSQGKEEHQAIGYLPDGTMVVVNNGSANINQTCYVTIASAMQTSSGRLIFAEIDNPKKVV